MFPNGSRWTSTTRSMRSTVRQQLRLFNAHYDEYGFQPIVVFDGRRPLRHRRASSRQAAELGKEIKPFLRAPRCARSALTGLSTEILLRADSHYCGPEVLDWCRANGRPRLHPRHRARQPRHCAAMSKRPRSQHEGEISRPRRETASFVVSWSSSTARKAGAGSSAGSSPGSKRALKDRTPASSSPI